MTKREAFRKVLPDYMKRANMNQRELAKAVGMSEAIVHCWLQGKAFPRIDTIQKIADALGCGTDDLLTVAEVNKPVYRYATDIQPVPTAEDKMKEIEARLFKVTPSDLEITPNQAKLYKAIGAMMKVDRENAVNLFKELVDQGIL